MQVYKMNERLKLSNNEVRLGVFIVNHRHDDFGSDAFMHCQDLLCDTPGNYGKTREDVCELLKYLGQKDTLDKFTSWELPKFPISGHKLIERGVKKGPILAKRLAALREKWKESRFTLTEVELMEYLEEVKTPKK